MSWTTYKGLEVPSSSSGDAGIYLTSNFEALADRSVYASSSDPSTGNDSTQGFATGSLWLNTSSLQLWQCISPASGSAVWSQVIQVSSGGVKFNSTILGLGGLYLVDCATITNQSGSYSNGSSGIGATFTYTATGAQTINGVALNVGTKVLLYGQTTATQNGPYIVTTAGATGVSCVLTRDATMNTGATLVGRAYLVSPFDTATGSWILINSNGSTPTVGSTNINYIRNTAQNQSTNLILPSVQFPSIVSNAATPTGGNFDCIYQVIGPLAANLTMNAPSNTPSNMSEIVIRLSQNGTGGWTVTWNAIYQFTATLTSALAWGSGSPAASASIDIKFRYNSTRSVWVCVENSGAY